MRGYNLRDVWAGEFLRLFSQQKQLIVDKNDSNKLVSDHEQNKLVPVHLKSSIFENLKPTDVELIAYKL